MIWSTLPDGGGSARAFSGRTLTLKMTRSLKGPGRDVVMGRVDLEADELQNREILKLRSREFTCRSGSADDSAQAWRGRLSTSPSR